ncbi:MAG: cysteine hydrolase [Lachnospiraceae bacterium]|jgi:nicotinamidase/pyrazinamidase|nr:cysteine hydrolase [Lachnospiraceae bacterium]
MKDILLVVDMQNDFIDGALGTPEAISIVPQVVDKIHAFAGDIICTRDTHSETYLTTQEGKNLPVPHCIEGTPGWQLAPAIEEACQAKGAAILNKLTFGSRDLPSFLQETYPEGIASLHIIGLCTDICVISNALLLKAFFPEVPITVDSSCCAGVTPESHETALAAMKMCQIRIE